MMGMDRDRRRLSFGPSAELYERYRPGYPPEAIAWLFGDSPLRVLDVGAGTGKLARVLLACGHVVVAVDPDPAMRAAFAAATPDTEILAGTAEVLPFADGSFDAVTAGQSFHWFDECRALPEIARVLRPGGLLAVVFNLRDESEPWVAELGRILRGQDGTGNSGTDAGVEDFGPLFGPVEHVAVPHVQKFDVPGLVGLAGTRSYALVLPPDERASMLAAVETLGRQVAAATPDGEIRLRYFAVCLRARLAGAPQLR
jgi:SAM-dependent methyltransferase